MTRRKRQNPGGSRLARKEHLPASLTRLDSAIAGLCEPTQYIVDGHLRFAPSRYKQLVDARAGKRGLGGTRTSKPITELWLDALMLSDEIHATVCQWQPVRFVCHAECVSIAGRLSSLRARSWRPQDVKQLDSYSDSIEAWSKQIETLLSSEARLTLPNPCPECGKKNGHKVDSAGERVRCAALHVSLTGAECTACHARWSADQLPFLGRLLEYAPLEGVVE